MNQSTKTAAQKIEQFFTPKKQISYSRGAYVLKAGAEPEYIYYLVSGLVRQFDISPHGDEVVVNVFKPGAFFPMSNAFNKTPDNYYFQAFNDVVVRRAPIQEVLSFVTSDSLILTDLLQRVYRGTDGLLKRMVQLMGGTSLSRFIEELLLQLERFGDTSEDNTIKLELSITELAARAGLTRETASRITSQLRESGCIKTSNHAFYITDKTALQQLLIERD